MSIVAHMGKHLFEVLYIIDKISIEKKDDYDKLLNWTRHQLVEKVSGRQWWDIFGHVFAAPGGRKFLALPTNICHM